MSEIESEESLRIGQLQAVIERILSEKNRIEELLSEEVYQKQQLVMALEGQKSSVTQELRDKVEEIKRHRFMIQKKISATTGFAGPELVREYPKEVLQVAAIASSAGQASGPTRSLLQRDMEYFELEKQRMMLKIVGLTTQLEEVRGEAERYKRIWDKVKRKQMPGVVGIMSKKKQHVDSSVENSL